MIRRRPSSGTTDAAAPNTVAIAELPPPHRFGDPHCRMRKVSHRARDTSTADRRVMWAAPPRGADSRIFFAAGRNRHRGKNATPARRRSSATGQAGRAAQSSTAVGAQAVKTWAGKTSVTVKRRFDLGFAAGRRLSLEVAWETDSAGPRGKSLRRDNRSTTANSHGAALTFGIGHERKRRVGTAVSLRVSWGKPIERPRPPHGWSGSAGYRPL